VIYLSLSLCLSDVIDCELDTNATMQRIDLGCKVLAPMVLGFMLQFTPLAIGLLIVGAWVGGTFIPELLLLISIYRRHRSLLEKPPPTTDETGESLLSGPPETRSNNPFVVLYQGWSTYFKQEAFLASLAFSILFLTILSPGGLTTAYLKSRV